MAHFNARACAKNCLFRNVLGDFHWLIWAISPKTVGVPQENDEIAPFVLLGWRAAATGFRASARVAAGRHA